MTDLTKIEKPYALCTKEEQEGLKALVGIEGALQRIDCSSGEWSIRPARHTAFNKGWVYRQNPDWQPPKLDVPDWFWENTEFNFVAIDKNYEIFAYVRTPHIGLVQWDLSGSHRCGDGTIPIGEMGGHKRIDKIFTHNFNPHNIPWDQSLTKRPEE